MKILLLGSLLFLSCEREKSSEGQASQESGKSLGLRSVSAREGAAISLSYREADDAGRQVMIDGRVRELGELSGAELITALRQGLEDDEELELATLGRWVEGLDIASAEAILLDHFRNVGWSHAAESFSFLENNRALSGPLLGHIVKGLAAESPEKAIDWLTANPDAPGAASAATTVGSELADKGDFSSSLQLVFDSDLHDDMRSNMIEGFIVNRITTDLEGTFEDLSALESDPLLDRAIYSVMNTVAKLNPADTMPWAEVISDEGLRRSAILEIAQEWAVEEPLSYQTWLKDTAPKDLLDELPAKNSN